MTPETFCEQFATFAEAPHGVAKLRELILQLAVQGQLVPQDVNDEPAREAQCQDRGREGEAPAEPQTAKRRQSSIAARQEPRPPDPDDIAARADNRPAFEIPTHWCWVTLDNVCSQITDGEHLTPPRTPTGEIPLATAKNVRDGFIDLGDTDFISRDTADKCWRRCQPTHDDILMVCVGATTGRLTVLKHPTSFVIVRSVALFRPILTLVVPEYLALLLRSPFGQMQIWRSVKQSAQPCLYISRSKQLGVPLPPLAEQRRIVGKVDQLLGLCDELAARQAARREARAALVGATLDRLVSASWDRLPACHSAEDQSPVIRHNTRQQPPSSPAHTDKRTLNESAEGRQAGSLSHAHRLRDHFDRLFDTPTTLPQLRQAILQLAVQGQLVPQDPNDEPAEMLLKRLATIRPQKASSEEEPRRQRKYREPELLQNQDELPVLPPSWKWVSADEVTHRLTYGITVRPAYVENGVPVISAREIRSGQVDLSIAKRIALSDFDGLRSKCKLMLNDVLFSKTGTIGSVAKVTTNEPLCSAQNIAVLSPLIWPDYLELVLRSPAIQKLATDGIKTTAIPDVQLGAISRFPIPLPPETEQKRIVSKVTELLSLCDALAAKLTQAESASTQLLAAAVHHLLNRGVPNG